MSLDTEKLHRIKGKSFDVLYNDHADKWAAMVDKARDYAQTCVGVGERVRIGDVVLVVQNAIRIDPTFENHVKEKSLPQKYWITWFAEFIVDCVYPQAPLRKNATKHIP